MTTDASIDVRALRIKSFALRISVAVGCAMAVITAVLVGFSVKSPTTIGIVLGATLIISVLMSALMGFVSLNAYEELEIEDGKISGKNLNVPTEYGYTPYFSYAIPFWFRRQAWMGATEGLIGIIGGAILLLFELSRIAS